MSEEAIRRPAARFRRLRMAVAAAMGLYVFVAVLGDLLSPWGEWFPVFSWSLFSTVEAEGYVYRLEITAINGVPLVPPQIYRRLTSRFPEAATADIRFNKLLFKIAQDAVRGAPNAERLTRLRDTYLRGAERVDWTVVWRRFDPIQHYASGEILEQGAVVSGRSQR